jgi:23S rRNA (adenine2503-C2)-methyltransferase
VNESKSSDGTKKYLYKVMNDKFIETAYIPDEDRATICVSSQVGCPLGCAFCATGKMGFKRNLTVNEILEQVVFFERWLKLAVIARSATTKQSRSRHAPEGITCWFAH